VRTYPGEPGVGVVIYHDDRSSTEVQLLHDTKPDTLETAHNDVIAHLVAHLRIHFNT